MEAPDKEALDEWYESPVTAYFVEILEERIQDTADSLANLYTFGEPFKTQDALSWAKGSYEQLVSLRGGITERCIEELAIWEEDDE